MRVQAHFAPAPPWTIGMQRIAAGLVPCFVGACLCTARAADADMLIFKGICDASAAIALDVDHIIVGDDEKAFLSIYGLEGGDSLERISLPHLDGDDEADIEGATIFGDRIVWIASNGRNADGEVKRKRFQLFASHRMDAQHHWLKDFSLSFDGLPKAIRATDGDDYQPLRKAVGDLDEDDPDLAPKKHGFNVEGLTISQDEQALLVGVRNPHPHEKAILFRIDNAAALLEGTAHQAKLGQIVSIDLGDRGIRDIAWSPKHHAYLIATGQTKDDEPGPDFALFRWDGSGSAHEITSFRSLLDDNPEFHPEAVTPLLEVSGGQLLPSSRVLVISDDGSRKLASGKECKDSPESLKSFRAVILTVE